MNSIKKRGSLFCHAVFMFALFFTIFLNACSGDGGSSNTESDSLTSVSISGKANIAPGADATFTAVPVKNGNPAITYAWSLSEENGATLSATSGESVSVSVAKTASDGESVTLRLSATFGETTKTAEKTITFKDAPTIAVSNTPVGYATITPQTGAGTTVTTKAELVSALSKGGLIYVNGIIDMSDGCLPSTAGGTTSALDAFVAEQTKNWTTKYTTYEAFKTAYANACKASTNDKSSSTSAQSGESSMRQELWKLNKAYGEKIKLTVKSNTTIIGLDGAVIKGGTFQIGDVSNVVIRNLTIQDAYDPFPHHEKDDGFNAQWDCIAIAGSSNSSSDSVGAKNIWIDHCTLEDTMKYSKVKINNSNTEEKWQTYDGLCDITKSSKNVVVSYCFFKNHDKTMLIGSSSDDKYGTSITIHHNRFLNCGQRLPMTMYPYMHIYNNSYERDSSAYYSQQACIAARYALYTIVAENNYFGSGIKNCITASTDAKGKCYESGNVFVSGNCALSTQDTKPFTPSYEYELDVANEIPDLLEENAGAGKWVVEQ